jgi:Flp pilus assembly protein TadG
MAFRAMKKLKAKVIACFVQVKTKEDGAAAIEFALVAMPFFGLLFGIFEMAYVFWANGVFTEAVNPVARLVLVGKAQTSNMDEGAFREKICERASAMFDCEKFVIDVRPYPSFREIKEVGLVKDGQVEAVQYNTGSTGEIIMVRVGYPWKSIMPFVGFMNLDLSNMHGGYRMLQATNVFKNEDY